MREFTFFRSEWQMLNLCIAIPAPFVQFRNPRHFFTYQKKVTVKVRFRQFYLKLVCKSWNASAASSLWQYDYTSSTIVMPDFSIILLAFWRDLSLVRSFIQMIDLQPSPNWHVVKVVHCKTHLDISHRSYKCLHQFELLYFFYISDFGKYWMLQRIFCFISRH